MNRGSDNRKFSGSIPGSVTGVTPVVASISEVADLPSYLELIRTLKQFLTFINYREIQELRRTCILVNDNK